MLSKITAEIKKIEKQKFQLQQEVGRKNVSDEIILSEIEKLEKQLAKRWEEYHRINKSNAEVLVDSGI
jgi:hypothetical protein